MLLMCLGMVLQGMRVCDIIVQDYTDFILVLSFVIGYKVTLWGV